MTTESKTKTDMYRRAAEKYGWRECSYLVRPSWIWQPWMDERAGCLSVLQPLLTLRHFAPPGPCPNDGDIAISLVANSPDEGCRVYHVVGDHTRLEAIARGDRNLLSSRDLVRCEGDHCTAANPLPLPASGWESVRVPTSSALLGGAQ